MRNFILIAVASFLVVGGITYAAGDSNIDAVNSTKTQAFDAGIYVGGVATSSTTNKITRALGNSAVRDIAQLDAGMCSSFNITVTGAKVGDPCFVGPDVGVASELVDCKVLVADTAAVQVCAVGEIAKAGQALAVDPPDASFSVRVFSAQ